MQYCEVSPLSYLQADGDTTQLFDRSVRILQRISQCQFCTEHAQLQCGTLLGCHMGFEVPISSGILWSVKILFHSWMSPLTKVLFLLRVLLDTGYVCKPSMKTSKDYALFLNTLHIGKRVLDRCET